MQNSQPRRTVRNLPGTTGVIVAFLAASLAAHLLIFGSAPLLLVAVGVLIGTVLLPGAALVLALFAGGVERPAAFELGLYAVGAGFAVATLTMLGLSYLPGPLNGRIALALLDLISLALLSLFWWQSRRRAPNSVRVLPMVATPRARYWFVAGAAILMLIGGYLRLANLGYAEFHGDEARAVLRGAGVIQGYEEVLLLHKKGPGEILVPTLQLAMGEGIDEAAARLPFAFASLAGLLAILALGTRLMGPLAGFAAAFLLTFDGYLVAFARFVQYQSVVFLLTTLAILLVYNAYRHPAQLGRALVLAALFFATALLFHYDAAAAFIPLLFLWMKIGLDRRAGWPVLLRATALPALLGMLMLAAFYVPYALHPHFQAVVSYLVGSRVGPSGFPHNNIYDIFLRTSLYSSAYYVMTMVALLTAAAYLAFRRGWSPRFANVALAAVALYGGLLLWSPTWLIEARNTYLLLGGLALLGLIWAAPRLSPEARMLWLWLGLPLLAAFFFIATPKTHVHVVLAPWALLAGGVADATAQRFLRQREAGALQRSRGFALGLATVAVLLTLLFGGYIRALYVQHDPEVLLNWEEAAPTRYWMPFDAPVSDSLYGFPFANGWKVVNGLYAQGVITGSFETNQWFEWIPDWYTRGQDRCASTADWYFAIDNPEPWSERSATIADQVQAQGYRPWGRVTIDEQPHMTIYRRSGDDDGENPPLQTFRLEEFAPAFDATAGPWLPLAYPVVDPVVGQPLDVNFNQEIRLEGFDLTYVAPLAPGDTMQLKLYWRALKPNLPAYKVTVQAYDPTGLKAVQKDSYSVCDRLPTSEWPPGELIEDIYELEIREEIPGGVYPLYVGLYFEETLARVPVADAAGAVIDDKALLTELNVVVGAASSARWRKYHGRNSAVPPLVGTVGLFPPGFTSE